jgi:hypothetical protein
MFDQHLLIIDIGIFINHKGHEEHKDDIFLGRLNETGD